MFKIKGFNTLFNNKVTHDIFIYLVCERTSVMKKMAIFHLKFSKCYAQKVLAKNKSRFFWWEAYITDKRTDASWDIFIT